MVAVSLRSGPARRRGSRPLVVTTSWYVFGVFVVRVVSPLICSRSLLGILLTAAWIPGQGCAITNTSNTILAATFIYSMCFDFLVLVLTAIKLGITGKSARKDRSKIVRLIFDDGLIFFMVA